jgi:hypothetical protein
MNRPKTGFKQRSEDDLRKANIQYLENYVDLFYEEKYEDKVRGARSLLFLLSDPNNMYYLVTQKKDMIKPIARTLKDEHKKNMELLIHLLAFFHSYSFYEEFHDLLIEHSIGETCMNIIEFQYAKYVIRKQDLLKKEKTNGFAKELDKFLFMVRKQDRILRLAFTILMHLAEDPKIERKMVKRDIGSFLVKNLDRNNVNLIVVMLLFIKKLSIYDENKNSFIQHNVLDELMK